MSATELPPGWRRVRFGDVVRKVSDRVDPDTAGIGRYVAGEHMDTDDLQIRRWGEVGDGYLGPAFHMRFRPGQVLYGSRRTYLRKVALPDFEGICANTTFVLETSSDSLLPDFLPLIMTTERFHEHSIKQSKGSVNPYINFSDLTWYDFPLPPVDEQRRIVTLLGSADRSLESLAGVATAVDTWRQSEMAELLAHFTRSVPLGDLCQVQYGLTLNSRRAALQRMCPYLRVANVQRGLVDLAEVKEVGCTDDEVGKYSLEDGDLLVVEGHANISDVGRSAIWRPTATTHPVLHQNHLLRVRTTDEVAPDFLLAVLNSRFGRRFFASRAKSTSGLNTINSTVLRSFPVPVVGVNDQREFVHRLALSDDLLADLSITSSSTRLLRQSLLTRALEVSRVH